MRPPLATLLLLALTTLAPGCGPLIITQRSLDSLREHPRFEWTAADSNGCIIYSERGSESASALPEIAAKAAAARELILRGLELDTYDPTLSIFVIDTRERMRTLIGRETNGVGFHISNAVCLVWPRTGSSGLRHEIAHVVAMNAWGVPERWINEGLAVHLTGQWIGENIDATAAALHDRGELPSLDDLTRRFNSIPSEVGYPAAGSLVGFIEAQSGLDGVRAVWGGGRRSLGAVTGMSTEELEDAWLGRLHARDMR
ncbi:MAG: hypothetical protein ACF8QF_13545 [Phycisphaerales bacterium]